MSKDGMKAVISISGIVSLTVGITDRNTKIPRSVEIHYFATSTTQ